MARTLVASFARCRSLVTTVMIILVVLPAEGADTNWLPAGTLDCVTDRIAGLGDDPKQPGRRYAGRVPVEPGWKNFKVTVSRRQKDPACRAEFDKKAQRFPEAAEWFGTRELWFECDSSYEAIFEPRLRVPGMRGDRSNAFQGWIFGLFLVSVDGTFLLIRHSLDSRSPEWSLQEGRCRHIDSK